jgi:hypothetical protein
VCVVIDKGAFVLKAVRAPVVVGVCRVRNGVLANSASVIAVDTHVLFRLNLGHHFVAAGVVGEGETAHLEFEGMGLLFFQYSQSHKSTVYHRSDECCGCLPYLIALVESCQVVNKECCEKKMAKRTRGGEVKRRVVEIRRPAPMIIAGL